MWVKTSEVGAYEGREVELLGWVHRRRDLGNKVFVILRDGSGIVQVVFEGIEEAKKLMLESSIIVKGTVVKDERAPTGYEVHAKELKIVHLAQKLPFSKDISVETQLDFRHLWVRSLKMQAMMRVKQTAIFAAAKFFRENDFVFVTPPIFVSSACEGGSTLFEVPYFDRKAYLSQSAQLYLEALIFSLERVWSLTPSFRAEKSRTRKHLTEYWHLEAEAAWVDFEENMEIQERLVKAMMKEILEKNAEELEVFKRSADELEDWVKASWPRISYEEAIELLRKRGVNISWGDDIGADEEKILHEEFGMPFFIIYWPREIKAFYMKVKEDDPHYVLASDLQMPYAGEIIGGSEREWKLELLLENMRIQELNPEDYEWYLDLRRYGSVPHSGFGLGMERFIMAVLKLEHVRDAQPFPRTITRVYP